MVFGIFWAGTTRAGAVAGMLAGLAMTVYYMASHGQLVRNVLGLGTAELWFGIQPVSAGVFGVPFGAAVIWLVSLVTRQGSAEVSGQPDGL